MIGFEPNVELLEMLERTSFVDWIELVPVIVQDLPIGEDAQDIRKQGKNVADIPRWSFVGLVFLTVVAFIAVQADLTAVVVVSPWDLSRNGVGGEVN